MSVNKQPKTASRISREKNKTVNDVRRLADTNSAAVARVLRSWLMGSHRDSK